MLGLRQDGARSLRNCGLGAVLAALWLAVATILRASSVEGPAERDDEFVRSSGGLGIPASAEPRWCLRALDPRLESSGPTGLRPVPGLIPFCPHETTGLRAAVPLRAVEAAAPMTDD